jgi:hypothetical protein
MVMLRSRRPTCGQIIECYVVASPPQGAHHLLLLPSTKNTPLLSSSFTSLQTIHSCPTLPLLSCTLSTAAHGWGAFLACQAAQQGKHRCGKLLHVVGEPWTQELLRTSPPFAVRSARRSCFAMEVPDGGLLRRVARAFYRRRPPLPHGEGWQRRPSLPHMPSLPHSS